MKRRLRNLLAFSVLAITAWMCFDNVFSDDAAIKALAEKAACSKKIPLQGTKDKDSCNEEHGLVREERMPWGQTVNYAWRDATISVGCHRAFYVFGERRCIVE